MNNGNKESQSPSAASSLLRKIDKSQIEYEKEKKFPVSLPVILILATLACGMIGFKIAGGYTIPDALFNCLMMFALNYSDPPINGLVDAARWLAIGATAGVVIHFVHFLHRKLLGLMYSLIGKSIAVFGDIAECSDLLKQTKYAIHTDGPFIQASRYILNSSENSNIEFYNDHRASIKDRPVYMKCEYLSPLLIDEPNLKLFSLEENAARIFWKRYSPYKLSAAKDNTLSIVIIGFGRLGEELLHWGLLHNIFSKDQHISYHVFGDCESFISSHFMLGEISDSIIPHSEPWQQNTDIITGADMVLLAEQQEQTKILRDMTLLFPNVKPIVFSGNSGSVDFLAQAQGCSIFDWKKEAGSMASILEEKLLLMSKKVNLRYCHIHNDLEETEENMETEWNKLNSFTKYSNISNADYHYIRLKMMKELGIPLNFNDLSKEQINMLAELEHIRWCRYHYLNNWKYGVPDSGKNKDNEKRIHKDLQPYAVLPEKEQKNDIDGLELLLGMSFDTEDIMDSDGTH